MIIYCWSGVLIAMHCVAQGYQKANTLDTGMDTLKWGTDYLLRTLAKQKARDGDKFPVYLIAYQVGNYTLDNSRWERPEMIKDPRPVYYVTTRNGECQMYHALCLCPVAPSNRTGIVALDQHASSSLLATHCQHRMPPLHVMIRQPE